MGSGSVRIMGNFFIEDIDVKKYDEVSLSGTNKRENNDILRILYAFLDYINSWVHCLHN